MTLFVNERDIINRAANLQENAMTCLKKATFSSFLIPLTNYISVISLETIMRAS